FFDPRDQLQHRLKIYTLRRPPARRPGKDIHFDDTLFEHVHYVRTQRCSAPIVHRLRWNLRRRTADLKPVILTKPAVPGIAAAAGLIKIVKPDLRLHGVARHRQFEWNGHMPHDHTRWILSVTHRRNHVTVDDFTARMKADGSDDVAEFRTAPHRE